MHAVLKNLNSKWTETWKGAIGICNKSYYSYCVQSNLGPQIQCSYMYTIWFQL